MAHILIIDDSATERHVVKSTLEKDGHQVSEAKDGEEGLQKARELKPNLVLMDLVMPGGVDGFKAIRQLHASPETGNIPIIVVSSKSEETDKVWAIRQGAADYLVKPVNKSVLKEKVNEHVGKTGG